MRNNSDGNHGIFYLVFLTWFIRVLGRRFLRFFAVPGVHKGDKRN